MKFSGLSRLVAKVKGVFSAAGRKGGKTEAALEAKRARKQREREEAPPREKRDSQPFPIMLEARRRTLEQLRSMDLSPSKWREHFDVSVRTVAAQMRDDWETRVDDGILKRAETPTQIRYRGRARRAALRARRLQRADRQPMQAAA